MPYQDVTLAELQIGMAQRWDGAVFWTDEQARLAINEALRDWNLLVGRWHTRATLATVNNQVAYSLPSSLVFGARVTVTGVPLHVTSTIELDLARPPWRLETTASGGDVPTVPIHWAPQGLTTIVIWPAKAVGVAADLAIDGVAATPVLVEAADTVDLGEELHDSLLDYALHLATFKEGGARWAATLPFFSAFLQLAAEENQLLKASRAYRAFAGLDRRRDLTPTRPGTTRLDGLADLVLPRE